MHLLLLLKLPPEVFDLLAQLGLHVGGAGSLGLLAFADGH
jgi:hypothetical protein